MSEIELKPTEYRVTGRKHVRRPLSQKALMRLVTLAGIWAASMIWVGRHFMTGKDILPVIGVSFAPAALILLYAIINDEQ